MGNTKDVDVIRLAEDIRQAYLFIQHEQTQLYELNNKINSESHTTFQQVWLTRLQRYVCDKLRIGELVSMDVLAQLNRLDASYHCPAEDALCLAEDNKLFPSHVARLRSLFVYLRTNPKAVSYLLFFAERKSRPLLDVVARIILSSIYSHCYLPQDANRIIEMLDELLGIYINFHKNIRAQMHASHSSFGLLYRSFCYELVELRNFFHLALYEPIMEVAAEDAYLDIDPAKAALRFDQQLSSDDMKQEYEEKLARYRGWIVKRLRYFVGRFINSLRSGMVAIPEPFARLIMCIYGRLVEHYNSDVCYTICTDLIFFYLLCPVIENPDAFGLVCDLHLSPMARYNLLQCSQMLQTIALCKCEKVSSSYRDVCEHFHPDSLSFVIDHIMALSKTHHNQHPKHMTEISSPLSHCLISQLDLKLLLTYIGYFLEQNMCSQDNPLRVYYDQLKDMLHFPVALHKKSEGKQKVTDKNREQESIAEDIRNFITTRAESVEVYVQYLLGSKQIIQIHMQEGGAHSLNLENMIGLAREETLLTKLPQLNHTCMEHLDAVWKLAQDSYRSEIVYYHDERPIEPELSNSTFYASGTKKQAEKFVIEMAVDGELEDKDKHVDVNKQDEQEMSLIGPTSLNLAYDMALANETGVDEDMEQPPSILMSKGFDMFDDHKLDPVFQSKDLSTSKLSTSQEAPTAASSAKKGLGVMLNNLKTLKDKVKNISLKDNRATSRPKLTESPTLIYSNSVERLASSSLIDFDVSQETFHTESVQKKTIEILDKYRPQGSDDDNGGDDDKQSLGDCGHDGSQTIDLMQVNRDVESKLNRLMRLIDMSAIYRSYRFLNLSNKAQFTLFLKIIHSQAHNVDNLTHVILLTDAIRLMESIDDASYMALLRDLRQDVGTRHAYQVYQLQAHQHCLDRLARLACTTQAFIEKERHLIHFSLVSCLVRFIIELNLHSIKRLVHDFGEMITADEKAEHVHGFIERLLAENAHHLGVLNERQSSLARQIIERHLMATIYLLVFYPHGDADAARDRLLHQQIAQLQADRLFTGNISPQNLTAFPWPSAQRELQLMAAYKTPRDKIACVVRCCKHIGTLLNASGKSIACSADDSLPVLIYVVVSANPKSILSTIQFVNSFLSKELHGEEAYYWTQFCSVVEYIKTILNQQ